ncbi:transmembrane and immunoglobulin domain-containing protein 2 isoform X2 [Melanerpes formicivorus]|uniref:transmembrane and immunoglobulin domain-containing protein 2 isoform X2 n=1 Tax=Melanerpes formicivorus TaxID=211600 RepID=UPI00358F22A0
MGFQPSRSAARTRTARRQRPLGDKDPWSRVARLAPVWGCWGLGVLIPLLGAAGALQVSQNPGEVQVAEGGRVALECQVLTAEPWHRLRLEWVKEHKKLCTTLLRPNTSVPNATCSPRLHLAWSRPRATLSLRQARGDDAGLYLCLIILEIPTHGTATGNGTLLRVTTEADGGHRAGLLWGLVGGLGAAVLLGLAILTHWCCSRNPDRNIYENMMPLSTQTPRKLPPPPKVMENAMYHVGTQRARGPPVAPRP